MSVGGLLTPAASDTTPGCAVVAEISGFSLRAIRLAPARTPKPLCPVHTDPTAAQERGDAPCRTAARHTLRDEG